MSPKEFWIRDNLKSFDAKVEPRYIAFEESNIEGSHVTHVIEHSAYQALKEEITRLQQELGKEIESHRKTTEVLKYYDGLYVFDENDEDSEQLFIDKPWRYVSGKRARARILELEND